jgi:hypothetical protein
MGGASPLIVMGLSMSGKDDEVKTKRDGRAAASLPRDR